MSKNNPVWPQVKRSFGTFVDKARRILGKVILIVVGSSACLYSMYLVAFTNVMYGKPSIHNIAVCMIGVLSLSGLGICSFFYIILKIIPFIWNGFHIRDLKL